MADCKVKTANLFDKDSYTFSHLYVAGDNKIYSSDTVCAFILNCKPNTTYTIAKMITSRFILWSMADYPEVGGTFTVREADNTAANLTITTGNNDQYILFMFEYTNSSQEAVTEQVANTVMYNEGQTDLPYEPYWQHSLRKLTTATETIQSGDTIYTDGQPITTYNIKGNEEHTGTPSPQNPVMPNGVGERTKNLLKNGAVSTEFRGVQYTVNADKSVTVYGTASPQISYFILMGDGAATNNLNAYTTPIFKAGDTLKFSTSSLRKLHGRNTDGTYINELDGTVTLSKDLGLIYIQVAEGASFDGTVYPMVTLSTETNTDYEPHGYKIPISSGGVSYPIYLSEPILKLNSTYANVVDSAVSSGTVTRYVQKAVLTGEETTAQLGSTSAGVFVYKIEPAIPGNAGYALCSHYQTDQVSDVTMHDVRVKQTRSSYWTSNGGAILFKDSNYSSLADFKSFLAQEYSNGTPVTVWYILTTATTETFTAPSIPTTEGANTITVDTTVQPSEFTATWTGWHNAYVKEKSENLIPTNISDYSQGSISPATGENTESTTRIRTNDYYPIEEDTDYYITVDDTNYCFLNLSLFDNNKQFVGSYYTINGLINGATSMKINIDSSIISGTKYFRALLRKADSTDITPQAITTIKPMINIGSTAQTYEPYWK